MFRQDNSLYSYISMYLDFNKFFYSISTQYEPSYDVFTFLLTPLSNVFFFEDHPNL